MYGDGRIGEKEMCKNLLKTFSKFLLQTSGY